MTEQEEKKLNFECIGAKLAPAEKKPGCLFVAKMAALLPVELEPLFSPFKGRNLSRGDSGLIGMASSSLWAVSPDEAASEVPEQRRFVC